MMDSARYVNAILGFFIHKLIISAHISDGAGPEDGYLEPCMSTNPEEIQTVVQDLMKDLAKRRRRKWLRISLTLLVIILMIVGLIAYQKLNQPPPKQRFKTAALESRNILQLVQSTGIVEPIVQVQIGAQVSGRVNAVHVDFNDRVKKGDLLAEIDPQLFGAEVVQSSAQLKAARAALTRAEAQKSTTLIRLSRLQTLVDEKVASVAELDQVQGDLAIAKADVSSAQAQINQINAGLKSARTTLTYTKIYSPIDGVVIDRQVEPGQTVASSFNTPLLFLLAKDLQTMKILAEIDEADVGKVKEGMAAKVEVDAYPGDEFPGLLEQIRLSPNTVEGVVTYSAVIIVENPGLKLRPGMTTTVSVTTRQEKDVLAIKNAALRFEPIEPKSDEQQEGPRGKRPVRPKLAAGEGIIYRVGTGAINDPDLELSVLKLGFSDGVWTKVISGAGAGEMVVIDEEVETRDKGFKLF